eukprot:bmy_17256T0
MDEKIFCCHGDQGLLCDLLWSDPDKDVLGWVENDRGVSFTFGAEVVAKFLHKYDLDLICRAYQVVEDGYKFFAKRQLVTLFSAPNCCGGFDNAGAMMSETLQQVKIISINNPLVFLNFHTDLMNIIQKENASNQPLDEISKDTPRIQMALWNSSSQRNLGVNKTHCSILYPMAFAMSWSYSTDRKYPVSHAYIRQN